MSERGFLVEHSSQWVSSRTSMRFCLNPKVENDRESHPASTSCHYMFIHKHIITHTHTHLHTCTNRTVKSII